MEGSGDFVCGMQASKLLKPLALRSLASLTKELATCTVSNSFDTCSSVVTAFLIQQKLCGESIAKQAQTN